MPSPLAELAEEGLIVTWTDDEGRPRWRLTDKGREVAGELLTTSRSAREYARRLLAERQEAGS